MDLFDDKNIKPMLIGIEGDPFDSEDHIIELKLDGVRCITHLDTAHPQVNDRCIVDRRVLPEQLSLSLILY